MEKKEFKVGEVFTAGLVKLKCVEGESCEGCVFEYNFFLLICRHNCWSMRM